MLKILSHVVAVAFLALSPEEIPEQTEPIQEERGLLTFAREIRSRKVIRNLNLVTVLAIGHYRIAFDAIHVFTTVTRTRFCRGFSVQFDRLVFHESPCTFMIATFQKIVVDVGVEVVDHRLRYVVHISIVTRSRGTVIHHRNTTNWAPSPRVHPRHIHLIHGGTARSLATLACCSSLMKAVGENLFQCASTVSRRDISPQIEDTGRVWTGGIVYCRQVEKAK